MTLALSVLLVAFLALVGYRLVRLRALAARPQPLMDAPALEVVKGGLPATGHLVWAGPLEHNEHGFITTARVPCQDADCHCRTHFGPGRTP